jgi:hypothetical protein
MELVQLARELGTMLAAGTMVLRRTIFALCIATTSFSQSVGAQSLVGNLLAKAVAGEAIGSIHNALEEGMICDGKADTSDTLNNLMRKAGSEAKSKGARSVVYLPPSATPCMLSRPIMLPSNTILLATPHTVTFKPLYNTAGDSLVLGIGDAQAVLVYGVEVDGGLRDELVVQTRTRVVLVYRSNEIVFDHVAVRHTRGIAIEWSTGITNSGIKNSIFEDIGNYWQTSHQRSDRAQALNWDCDTGSGQRHHDLFLFENHMSNIGYDPISICAADRIQIKNNDLSIRSDQYAQIASAEYPGGIYVVRSSDVLIKGNSIIGAAGACIDVADTRRVTVEGNEGSCATCANCCFRGTSPTL